VIPIVSSRDNSVFYPRQLVVCSVIVLATSSVSAEPASLSRTSSIPAAKLEETPEPNEESLTVNVVGVAPVPGAEIALDKFPGSVQRVRRVEIERSHEYGLSHVLGTQIAGVTLSDAQSSTLQPDVNYRGFTSSAVLGVPQGLAVYQGGMRVSDPLGDTVEWDLIPTFAIEQADLLTGMNAVYGLNALGGALVLQMKDGFSPQGTHARASAGSFGRYTGLLESAVNDGTWGVYAGGDVFGEAGFRDHSPSAARRLYADVRRRDERYEVGLTLSAGNTELTGNGPVPIELQKQRRSAVFTHPDTTRNTQALLGADARARLSPVLWIRAGVYLRRSVRTTLNGDEADFVPCALDVSILCDDEGEPIASEAGEPVPESAGGSGLNNTTRTVGTVMGGALSTTLTQNFFGRKNHLTFGISADVARAEFGQRSEIGELTANRGVAGSGIRLDGAGLRTGLSLINTYFGAFATNTLSVTEKLHITASGRWNSVRMHLSDTPEAERSQLSGNHVFARFNPAAGASFVIANGVSVYTNYSEASRAPSAVELGCADEGQPCRVPNAFLSDPPLDQVVTRLAEIGTRVHQPLADSTLFEGSLAVFGSQNSSDILFVAGSRLGTGYFRNAGTTQRIGLETSARLRVERVRLYALYQLLRATFESNLMLPGENHPFAQAGPGGAPVILVRPGARLPNTPMHFLRLGASVQPTRRLALGASMSMSSSLAYRGDEANWLAPVPGYAVLGVDTSYRVTRWLSVFVQAENVLDTKYARFGVLGDASNVVQDGSDPRFVSPGDPFGMWAGIEAYLE